ncbi:cyclic AMP response element-binding protein B-like isoform X3 [Teleopsis dalmanni]|uniref:cyclic AMP response element-binding protein B-like isoform X3 n=1 Tax=Teleopsis dalmanni TaxID=139649 RepID=UPI0018CF08FF|nr:cyclic AMP response element-binding protein B-like isoform X3 [Teleopsis dalmanni]
MDSIVEENGNSNNVDEGHNLSTAQQQSNNSTNSTTINVPPPPSSSVLTTTSNVVQYLPPHGLQSVIQAANQSSVIQTAATTNAMSKNVVFVSKPNTTVIHTTSGNAVQLPPNFLCKIKPEPNTHHLDSNSEDSLTDEDSPRRHRELTRRPSYHKIFTEISGPDISDNSGIAEDQTRKREIRLQKNREAARECRRKKKEYIKCLENRVAVLENQNKALIEELKSLKELYCQSKND